MKKYGTGSDIQQAISAATAAVQGLAGGDLKAAIAGGAAPYLAEVIHNRTKDASGEVNISANLMAHAVLGAVVASAQGNSALAGAAGASVGEAVGIIAKNLYNKDASDLSEDEKQTVRTLGMLAAGLAGGLAGDSAGSVVSGAQAGKNAVENNALNNCSPVTCKAVVDVIGSGAVVALVEVWSAALAVRAWVPSFRIYLEVTKTVKMLSRSRMLVLI